VEYWSIILVRLDDAISGWLDVGFFFFFGLTFFIIRFFDPTFMNDKQD